MTRQGYGRIVREKAAEWSLSWSIKMHLKRSGGIKEVNTGILAVNAAYLNDCLDKVDNDNAQGEYYLTDIIALAVNDGNEVINDTGRP
jgi:bifunctional UDP-N-acetylglucosamine pyrophosphorylase/glucosamine-1-phosphate N-acetyltransferase